MCFILPQHDMLYFVNKYLDLIPIHLGRTNKKKLFKLYYNFRLAIELLYDPEGMNIQVITFTNQIFTMEQVTSHIFLTTYG